MFIPLPATTQAATALGLQGPGKPPFFKPPFSKPPLVADAHAAHCSLVWDSHARFLPGVMVQREGERSGYLEGGVLITRHPPLDRPFVQRVNVNVDMHAMLPAPPGDGAPPHARFRLLASGYAVRVLVEHQDVMAVAVMVMVRMVVTVVMKSWRVR